jgi:DNA-binding transcriptional LysR family regulator
MAALFNRIPPLHLLIAFEAASRLGSFARAAEELSVTPSAVSHRIKNLEELWGEDLFVRANTALRLTAAGTRYLRNVQDALKSLNELARPEYNKMRTRLRVATPPTFGRQHLVPRLPEFGNLLVMLQFGTMPAEMTRRNMERFAQDVMPLLRKASKEQFGEFSFVA